jgi:glutathione S-transferase
MQQHLKYLSKDRKAVAPVWQDPEGMSWLAEEITDEQVAMQRRLAVALQGMGRHSFEFVKRRMAEELDACNELLAKSGAFLTGSTPCQADCFLFAALEVVCHPFQCMAAIEPEYSPTTLIRNSLIRKFDYPMQWPVSIPIDLHLFRTR